MTQKIVGIKEVISKYSTYFFDLDGVVVSVGWFSGVEPKGSKEVSRH